MPKSPLNKTKRGVNRRLQGHIFNYVFTNNKNSKICPICDNRGQLFYNEKMRYYCCNKCNLKTNFTNKNQTLQDQDFAEYVRQQFRE